MTLGAEEFMRRFLLHVLPSGFHRIRHYGLIANAQRNNYLARARELLQLLPNTATQPRDADAPTGMMRATFVCPDCGAAMIIIDTFVRGQSIRAPPPQRGAS
jgi:hypothetical protein